MECWLLLVEMSTRKQTSRDGNMVKWNVRHIGRVSFRDSSAMISPSQATYLPYSTTFFAPRGAKRRSGEAAKRRSGEARQVLVEMQTLERVKTIGSSENRG